MPNQERFLEDIKQGRWNNLRSISSYLHESEIAGLIADLPLDERAVLFRILPQRTAAKVFEYLDSAMQQELMKQLGQATFSNILNAMSPDDRTAFLEELPDKVLKDLLNQLSDEERKAAVKLLGYPENSVGRLMTPYYIQVHPDWKVSRVLEHIRKRSRKAETLNYIYVVDAQQRLIDDLRTGQILMAPEEATIESLMDQRFAYLKVAQDREEAIAVFKQYDRSALPVVTDDMTLVGIVTADDILDVAEQEDTEDIQKFGGLESLDLPYVSTRLFDMFKKRISWLVILFLGEMLTATAMGHFEEEIEKAVVLALFVPLIISSGGNSGSQAATLIIRAMALKELTLPDWWFVMRREILSGLMLGVTLGLIGFLRIWLWQQLGFFNYGEHWALVGLTIGLTLIGIVTWGTLSGSMIPFVLKKAGLDPATSSAPFVATMVDVTGLVIYFSIASLVLRNTIL